MVELQNYADDKGKVWTDHSTLIKWNNIPVAYLHTPSCHKEQRRKTKQSYAGVIGNRERVNRHWTDLSTSKVATR